MPIISQQEKATVEKFYLFDLICLLMTRLMMIVFLYKKITYDGEESWYP